jgi:phenylacetic acid degradation operon negative regulatory protein
VVGDALRPRAGSSAKALLLTLLGEFVLPHGHAAWTGTLVRALALLDVEEKNARQALARTAAQGLLTGERDGRRVRWTLTPAGVDLLTTGTRRIYDFGGGDDGWDQHWLVVLCPVPEEQRAKRHQLRSRLGFAGFGFVGAGMAITPHLEREPEANAILCDLDLVDGAVVLHAETGSLTPAVDLLHRAWDLDALGRRYRDFLDAFADRPVATNAGALASLALLVHEWRRFPFVDPELPDALLPAGWPGRRAKARFDELHAAWAPRANACYEALEADSARIG